MAKLWAEFFLKTGEKAEVTMVLLKAFGWDRAILEGSVLQRTEALALITSPISNETVKVREGEFSAGNMFIDVFAYTDLMSAGVRMDSFRQIVKRSGLSEDEVLLFPIGHMESRVLSRPDGYWQVALIRRFMAYPRKEDRL